MVSNERGVLLDGDGTLYKYDTPIPGAKGALEYLLDKNIPFVILSNTGEKMPEDVARKISRVMNIAITSHNVLTAMEHMLDVIRNETRKGIIKCLYYISKNELDIDGIRFTSHTSSPQLNEDGTVIAIFTDGVVNDYCNTLEHVASYLNAGARVYITSLDDTISGESRRHCGPGIVANILETLSIKKCNIRSFGKGSVEGIGTKAISRLKSLGFAGKNKDVVIIGDRFDTDVRQGNRDGLYSILVETGCHNLEDRKQYPRDFPNAVVSSIDQVFPFDLEDSSYRRYIQNCIFDQVRSISFHVLKGGHVAKDRLAQVLEQLHIPPKRIQSSPADLCKLAE